jgi:GTP-binding protein
VVANKMDLDEAEENLTQFRQRFPKVEIISVSAKLEEGLGALRELLCERVGKRNQ